MSTTATGIRTFPMYCIIMLALGLMNHVIVIPPLLQSAKRDAWISVIAVLIPYLIWIVILRYIMKQTDQKPILEWVRQQRFGRAISGGLRVILIGYLFMIGVVTVKETINWTHGSYLPRTPDLILSITLMLLCFCAAWAGMRAIAIVSGILLPFVILFGDFVMSANLPRKSYILLTPMLEHGLKPVLEGCLYVGGGLAELFVLLLVQHHLKSKMRLWSLSLLGIFLVILIIGPVMGAIAEFGPYEAADLRYPAYEEWRLVRLGRYIQHVDFLSIYQWLSGAFARISISLLLMTELAAGGPNGKQGTIWLISFSMLFVILVALPVSDIQFFSFLKLVYLPASLYTATGMLVVLFVMALIHAKRTRGKKHGGVRQNEA
ncbi:GerAB/ArcD/ProY family transporter [Paenibacillus soyae]|uniref:Endospore germination permease n=1 Tax=Paenibacillus soyae TaxID=2969249 RepID=A0A9X2S8S9_9BACL|nr:endospore germination permease [Paenibacillus soyae]MCR2804470.1 endospore germination permease [Paenibacillus soyae]